MSAIRIAFAAKKGGVGKSTCAINFAGYLAKQHKCRVLVVDTDSQSSSSQFFMKPEAVDALEKEQTIAAVFDSACEVNKSKIVHASHIENLYFAPASDHLKRHNLPSPEETGDMQFVLREFLDEVDRYFDFIVMDTPPLLETLPTWACLVAADYVLAPLNMEMFAVQAISGLQQNIDAARELNPSLHFLGYIVNRYDQRRSVHVSNQQRLRSIHGASVLKTVLTNLTAYTEAQMLRTPITHYAKAGDAAQHTTKLAREAVHRIQMHIKDKQSKTDERKVA